jgi:phosphate transport system substrate-binding protein
MKNIRNCQKYILLLFVAVTISLHSKGAFENSIIITESEMLAPVMADVAELFREKNIVVSVEGKGSHSGIYSLINGRCDIAESSTPISAREMDLARANGIPIREYLIAYDMIVPIVHPNNSVKNLSMETLRNIFSGSIKTWGEVGGNLGEIRLVVRDNNSGTRDVWEMAVSSSKGVSGVIEKSTNSAVLSEVAHDENAIGYVGYSFLNSEVKAVSIDGVTPSITNANTRNQKRYPITRPLFIYINEKKITSPVREFLIFLFSAEGGKVFQKRGFIPEKNPGGKDLK